MDCVWCDRHFAILIMFGQASKSTSMWSVTFSSCPELLVPMTAVHSLSGLLDCGVVFFLFLVSVFGHLLPLSFCARIDKNEDSLGNIWTWGSAGNGGIARQTLYIIMATSERGKHWLCEHCVQINCPNTSLQQQPHEQFVLHLLVWHSINQAGGKGPPIAFWHQKMRVYTLPFLES